MKQLHFISGLVLSIFVTLHLFNHLLALDSIETHIWFMTWARLFYQNILIEPILILAVLVQVLSGIQLVRNRGWKQTERYNKLHVYSGLYLAFFLLMHTSAVLAGRFWLQVDTNFYYGAMVANVKPFLFFYIPYYFLGTLSFFVHIACIFRLKVLRKKGSQKANQRFKGLFIIGITISLLIIIGLTYKVELPKEYMDLMDVFG